MKEKKCRIILSWLIIYKHIPFQSHLWCLNELSHSYQFFYIINSLFLADKTPQPQFRQTFWVILDTFRFLIRNIVKRVISIFKYQLWAFVYIISLGQCFYIENWIITFCLMFSYIPRIIFGCNINRTGFIYIFFFAFQVWHPPNL